MVVFEPWMLGKSCVFFGWGSDSNAPRGDSFAAEPEHGFLFCIGVAMAWHAMAYTIKNKFFLRQKICLPTALT